MDCREVIVPVVWVLGRPYRKLLQLRVTLVCDERDTATVPSCSAPRASRVRDPWTF